MKKKTYSKKTNSVPLLAALYISLVIFSFKSFGQELKLTPSDLGANDEFGVTIDTDGDYAVMGVSLNDEIANDAGAVYIFKKDASGNWLELKKLTASDCAANDRFGNSVSIQGDYLVVGALLDDDNGNGSGSVYLFKKNFGGIDNWGEFKKLKATDGTTDDNFGSKVGLDGNHLIVAAMADDDKAFKAGSVYIFKKDFGGTDNWGEFKKLVAYDGDVKDHFGAGIDIEGNTLVVGALWGGPNISNYDAGAIYIYYKDVGGTDNWGFVKKINASDACCDDRFGNDLKLNGNWLLISAHTKDSPNATWNDYGAAYLLERNHGGTDNWGEVKKLVASNGSDLNYFSHKIAFDGEYAIIGSRNYGTRLYEGIAYIFKKDYGGAGNWGEYKTIQASDGKVDNGFGAGIAINGDEVLIGSRKDDEFFSVGGAVYVYDVTNLNVSLSANKVDVTCHGANNGSIVLTPSGGIPPYIYQWSNNENTKNLQNLTTGSYQVTVTDSNNSTATGSYSISEPTKLTITSTKTDITCFDENDGSINTTVNGGEAPYTYLWNDGDTNPNRSGLTPGDYSVTVTDDNGCTATTDGLEFITSLTAPADSESYSYTVYTTPSNGGNVTLFAKTTWWTDWYANTGLTGSFPNLVEKPFSGGSGCDWIDSYPQNNTGERMEISRSNQLDMKTATIIVAPGKEVAIAGNDCGLSDNIHAHYYIEVFKVTGNGVITISEPTELILSAISTQPICPTSSDGTIDLSVSGGTESYNYSWNDGTTTQNRSNIGEGTYTVVVTDANSCSKSLMETLASNDIELPQITCPADVMVNTDPSSCHASNVNLGTPNTSDNCTVASVINNAPTQFSVGMTSVTWTATDDSGNSKDCTHNVTVEDIELPTAICQNLTVELDTNGDGSISANQVNNGSSDACGIQSLSLDKSSFDCTNIGANMVVLTVTDNNGNAKNCNSSITVEDNLKPQFNTCPTYPTAFALDLGECYSTINFINPDISDNCAVKKQLGRTRQTAPVISSWSPWSNNPSGTFTEGTWEIRWWAKDQSGNANTCTRSFTVSGDSELPNAQCKDHTANLNSNGTASISVSDIDDNSTDNCGVQNISLDYTTFDCDNSGTQTVTLTVTDINNLVNSCTAVVTIEDNVLPTVTCQDVIIELDENGEAILLPSQIEDSSHDNCGVVTKTVTPNTFDCDDIGFNTVLLTVKDLSYNPAICAASVYVEDNTKPEAQCKNHTVQLDAYGNALITASDIDDNSTDNCGSLTPSITPSSFDCDDLGAQTVTLTMTDESGNMDDCTTTVTVEDSVQPIAKCKDFVATCAGGQTIISTSDIDDGSSDNCGITSMNLDQTTLDCTNPSATVTLTVMDSTGNSDNCTSVVTFQTGLAVTISDFTEIEGENDPFGGGGFGTIFIFELTRSGGTGAMSVDFTTADGTAIAGSDYESKSGTVTWTNGGSNTEYIQIQCIGDYVCEPDEIFYVNLSNPSGGAVILDGQGIGTILDDDCSNPIIIDPNDDGNQIINQSFVQEASEFVVFPNPVTRVLNLNLSNDFLENGSIQGIIVDNLGQEIQLLEIQHSHTKINIEDLQNGIYHIVLFGKNKERYSKRFVKVK